MKCEVKPTFRRLDGGKGSLASFSKVALIPAADPAVTYEWWIDNPSLAVGSGSMTFTASVRSRVGTQTNTEARTVPAQLAWEPAGGHVRLGVGAFTVPLRIGSTTIVSVDVARYYNLALSIQPQTFSLALPDGSFRQINARPVSGSVQYLPGRVVLDFGLGF